MSAPITVTQAVGAFSYETQIGDANYVLTFRWNTRAGYWTLSIYDANGNALYEGRRVLLNEVIFGEIQIAGMPTLNLVPADQTELLESIGRGDLGNAVQIYAI